MRHAICATYKAFQFIHSEVVYCPTFMNKVSINYMQGFQSKRYLVKNLNVFIKVLSQNNREINVAEINVYFRKGTEINAKKN